MWNFEPIINTPSYSFVSSSSSSETRRISHLTSINDDANRRDREEKTFQIRKDKRNDLTNIRRQKLSDEASFILSESSQLKKREDIIRNLVSLTEKSKLIFSEKQSDQEIAIEFFRRLLAIDRKPPIGVVIERGVLPRIIEFIESSNPKIAFEAVWCITNISCGEPQHLHLLLELGAISKLLKVICETKFSNIREQCLWTVSNLATDTTGQCRVELIKMDVMKLILWQLDIDSPPSNLPRQESPALSIMRYSSWIMCSLAKNDPVLPQIMQKQIIFAFAELLYSPDADIIGDICLSLCSLCEYSDENIQYCLEQGIPNRLSELCELNNAFAIRPLCVMLQSRQILFRRVLMSSICPDVLKLLIKDFSIVTNPNSTVLPPATRTGPIVGTAGSSIGLLEYSSSSKCLADYVSEDICKAFLALFQTDVAYLSRAIELGYMTLLINAILGGNSYTVKTLCGYCLCEVISKADVMDPKILNDVLMCLKEQFTSTDNVLLVRVLQCVLKVGYMHRRIGSDSESPLQVIADDSSLAWLCNHAYEEISVLALKIVDISSNS